MANLENTLANADKDGNVRSQSSPLDISWCVSAKDLDPERYKIDVMPQKRIGVFGGYNKSNNTIRVYLFSYLPMATRRSKSSPEEFPLEETIIDSLSDIPIHELIHTEGINHDKYSEEQFFDVLSKLGHGSSGKVLLKSLKSSYQ